MVVGVVEKGAVVVEAVGGISAPSVTPSVAVGTTNRWAP